MFVEYNEASWFLNLRYTCVLVNNTLGDLFGKEPGLASPTQSPNFTDFQKRGL